MHRNAAFVATIIGVAIMSGYRNRKKNLKRLRRKSLTPLQQAHLLWMQEVVAKDVQRTLDRLRGRNAGATRTESATMRISAIT